MEPASTFDGEVYRLPVRTRPSWLNIEGGMGFFAGAAAGIVAAGVMSWLPWSIGIGGALLGGAIGKNRMQKECEEGESVRPPRYFNKTMVAGLLVGICCAAALVPLFFTGLPLLGTLATVALVGGGALAGSVTEQMDQAQNYERAKERHIIEMMKASEQARGIHPPYDKDGPETKLPEYRNNAARQNPGSWQSRNPSKAGEKPAAPGVPETVAKGRIF